jgi:hypothetical protein
MARRSTAFRSVSRAREPFQAKRGPNGGTGRHARGRTAGRSYRPGDTVRQTGIYEVVHDREHRATHDAVMLGGDVFPSCDTCDRRVRFRLVRTAPYIFHDEDFETE